MKCVASWLIFLPLVFSSSIAVAEGRYDPYSGSVDFDCVKIPGEANGLRAYSLSLVLESNGDFSIADSEAFLSAEDCDSSYHIQSNKLLGDIRVVDDIYSVELEYNSETETFSLLSAEYSRLSETALWVVSNGHNKLYLGGTIHRLQESDFPVPPAYLIAYENSEVAVFEYDPAIPISSEDFEKFNLPSGESVLEYMTQATQAITDDFLRQFGRTLDDYARRRPEFFNSILYSFGAQSFGFGSGVDDYFINLAKSDGKQTGGLETAGEQIQAVSDGYKNQQINWNLSFLLRLAYIQGGQLHDDLRQLIDRWRVGRADLIALSNEQYQRFYPQQYESILANRNRNWIPVIESYLETPEVELILAGFAHLAGPDNVLGLLEDLGYTVERYIPYASPFDGLAPDIVVELESF